MQNHTNASLLSPLWAAKRTVVVLLTSLLLASCTEGGAPLEVADAYVRQPPPGMKMTAAFATLSNPGNDAVVLTGASSEGFSSVSIHETALVDGVARMRPVPQLEVGPGETVVLEPGGLHLMLMGAQGPVSADQTVSVTLQLGDGEQMIIEMPVRAPR